MQKNIIRQGTFLLLVVLVTMTFFGLIQSFLLTSFWAALLALVFRNTFRRLRIRLRGRDNLAASLTTLLILFVVVIPLFFVTVALVNQSAELYVRIQSGEVDANIIIDWIESRVPIADEFLKQFGYSFEQLKTALSEAALSVTQAAAGQAINFTQNAINWMVQFFLMLYLLFFFLRDGQQIMKAIMDVLPMGNRREKILFQRFAKVSRATLKGTLIVAIVQGSIGGILFALVGIEGAVFWGAVMTLLSLLPVGGSGLVWIPAAIIMFVQGSYIKGIIIVITGVLIIGLIDNFLRPMLVGRDTEMPDYLILLATLGGIAWFGLSGFVLGPVVAALFITCWDMMGKEYGGKDR